MSRKPEPNPTGAIAAIALAMVLCTIVYYAWHMVGMFFAIAICH